MADAGNEPPTMSPDEFRDMDDQEREEWLRRNTTFNDPRVEMGGRSAEEPPRSSGRKILPALDAEDELLGAIMADPGIWPQASRQIRHTDFALPGRGEVWRAMVALEQFGEAPNPVAVSQEMRNAGTLELVGDLSYLSGIAREALLPVHKFIAGYVRRVLDGARRRQLAEVLRSASEDADAGMRSTELLESIKGRLAQLETDLRADGQGLRLESLDEFTTRPQISWLIRDLMPAESIIVVFGAPKSGKTHVVIDMCMHGAHGMHWHGRNLAKPLKVAYLAGEGRNGLRARLHAWRRLHQTELRGDFRLLPEALSLPARIDELLMVLKEYGPDLLVLDTLNAYFGGGDENSTQDMTAFVAAVRRLRDELRCVVLIVHHTGWAEATRERGSNVLRGAVDVIAQVARPDEASPLVGFQVLPSRDIEGWKDPLALRLVTADTDWADDDGRPIRTALLEPADEPVTLPGRQSRPISEHQTTTLAIIAELSTGRPVDANSGLVLVGRHEVIEKATQQGIDRRRIHDCWKPLTDRGLIKLVEPGSVALIRIKP